jgi:hypothetical protein
VRCRRLRSACRSSSLISTFLTALCALQVA